MLHQSFGQKVHQEMSFSANLKVATIFSRSISRNNLDMGDLRPFQNILDPPMFIPTS